MNNADPVLTGAAYTAIAGIVVAVIGFGGNAVITWFKGRFEKPVARATADETQAKADALIADNNLRAITRLDNMNKQLQERLDAQDVAMMTIRNTASSEIGKIKADYEQRLTRVETERIQDKALITALDNTVKRQSAQIRVLTDMVIGLGGTPPPFDSINGKT